MRIVLLRHGATEANIKRIYCGKTDIGLSEEGVCQLRSIRESHIYPSIDGLRLVTSGMKRTNETLWQLFERLPEEEIPELREMDFGLFEMRSYEELKKTEVYIEWICDQSGEHATPGGESRNDFRRRVLSAFERIDRDSLIVCHGGAIAAIMGYLFPKEQKNMYEWQPSNGCGYEIIMDEKGNKSYASIPFNV